MPSFSAVRGHVPFVRAQLAQDVSALEGLARLLERAVALGARRPASGLLAGA